MIDTHLNMKYNSLRKDHNPDVKYQVHIDLFCDDITLKDSRDFFSTLYK
jgi:hypothetical protein